MAQNTPPGASPADDACSETSSESSLDSVDYEFFVNGSDDILDGTIDPVDDLELGNDFIEGVGSEWTEQERAPRSADGTPQPITLDPFGEGTRFNVWGCAQDIYECIIDRFKSFRSKKDPTTMSPGEFTEPLLSSPQHYGSFLERFLLWDRKRLGTDDGRDNNLRQASVYRWLSRTLLLMAAPKLTSKKAEEAGWTSPGGVHTSSTMSHFLYTKMFDNFNRTDVDTTQPHESSEKALNDEFAFLIPASRQLLMDDDKFKIDRKESCFSAGLPCVPLPPDGKRWGFSIDGTSDAVSCLKLMKLTRTAIRKTTYNLEASFNRVADLRASGRRRGRKRSAAGESRSLEGTTIYADRGYRNATRAKLAVSKKGNYLGTAQRHKSDLVCVDPLPTQRAKAVLVAHTDGPAATYVAKHEDGYYYNLVTSGTGKHVRIVHNFPGLEHKMAIMCDTKKAPLAHTKGFLLHTSAIRNGQTLWSEVGARSTPLTLAQGKDPRWFYLRLACTSTQLPAYLNAAAHIAPDNALLQHHVSAVCNVIGMSGIEDILDANPAPDANIDSLVVSQREGVKEALKDLGLGDDPWAAACNGRLDDQENSWYVDKRAQIDVAYDALPFTKAYLTPSTRDREPKLQARRVSQWVKDFNDAAEGGQDGSVDMEGAWRAALSALNPTALGKILTKVFRVRRVDVPRSKPDKIRLVLARACGADPPAGAPAAAGAPPSGMARARELIVRDAVMAKVKTSLRESVRVGLGNEEHLRCTLQSTVGCGAGFDVHSLAEAGLRMHRTISAVRASVDAVAMVSWEGEGKTTKVDGVGLGTPPTGWSHESPAWTGEANVGGAGGAGVGWAEVNAVAVEFKTATEPSTLLAARKLAASCKEKTMFIDTTKEGTAKVFAKVVPLRAHRAQLLQGATALGLHHSMYIVGAPGGEIIRTVVVKWGSDAIKGVEACVGEVVKTVLPCIDPAARMPNVGEFCQMFDNVKTGEVSDRKVLYRYFEMARELCNMTTSGEIEINMRVKYIKPVIVVLWNNFKGADDITSRLSNSLMKGVIKDTTLTANQLCVIRDLTVVMCNAWRMWAYVRDGKPPKDFKVKRRGGEAVRPQTVSVWREARLKAAGPLQSFCESVAKHLIAKALSLESTAVGERTPSTTPASSGGLVGRRLGTQAPHAVGGVVGQQHPNLIFGLPRFGGHVSATPKRSAGAARGGTAAGDLAREEIKKLQLQCCFGKVVQFGNEPMGSNKEGMPQKGWKLSLTTKQCENPNCPQKGKRQKHYGKCSICGTVACHTLPSPASKTGAWTKEQRTNSRLAEEHQNDVTVVRPFVANEEDYTAYSKGRITRSMLGVEGHADLQWEGKLTCMDILHMEGARAAETNAQRMFTEALQKKADVIFKGTWSGRLRPATKRRRSAGQTARNLDFNDSDTSDSGGDS